MADIYTRVKDVEVNLSKMSAAGSVGLGIPLVISGCATKEVAYKECNGIGEVITAGFAEGTEVYKACAAIFAQAHKPKTVAVCATASKISEWLAKNGNKDYRQIIPVYGEDDSSLSELVTAVSALEHKMLFDAVKTKEELPAGTSDRAVVVVYNGASAYPNAAVVGESAGRTAGSFTYKNLVLTGIEPEDLDPADVKAIHTAGGICILKKAGDVVTSEGITTAGEYVDIIDSEDYIISNMVYKGQKLLNDSDKISFDNVGISQLENVVTDVLADAFTNGIIATTEDGEAAYSVDFATREESTASDRTARHYKGGRFSFDLAGAIHNVTINGTLVV